MPETKKNETQSRVAGWEDANVTQLIVFRIGQESFGVPIDDVREVIRAGTITPIPDSPRFIRGLINVRGDIIPTIELRVTFNLPQESEKDMHIVVTRNQESVFGLLVDEVTEVLRIPQGDIKKPPKLLTTIHEDYVAGVVTVEDKLTIILDLKKILSDEELEKLNESTRDHLLKQNAPLSKKGKKLESRSKKTERKPNA